MLNQSQYKEMVKTLNSISDEIDDLIIKAKEDFNNNENKEALQRGLMMGKVAALGLIKNLFRSRADYLYKLEGGSVDVHLLDQVILAHNINMVLTGACSENEPNLPVDFVTLMKDQTFYLEAVLERMKLILKQAGTIIE